MSWRRRLVLLLALPLAATLPYHPQALASISTVKRLSATKGARALFSLKRSLAVEGIANETTGASTLFRLPRGSHEGGRHWYVLSVFLAVSVDPEVPPGVAATVSLQTSGHDAILLDLASIVTNGHPGIHWSTYTLFNGPEEGDAGDGGVLHLRNYVQAKGVHAGKNSLAIHLEQADGLVLRSIAIQRGSKLQLTRLRPSKLNRDMTPSHQLIPDRAANLAPIWPTFWNYDFYQNAIDASGYPSARTDNPVTIVFGDNASVRRVKSLLGPDFACRNPHCGGVAYEPFFSIKNGTTYWLQDRGVKTPSFYTCPSAPNQPADYHIRLYGQGYDYRYGYMVLGTTHMDCGAEDIFGWQESAERFVAARFAGHYSVIPDDLAFFNRWGSASSSTPGCENGVWAHFAHADHCMQSDGYATYVDLTG